MKLTLLLLAIFTAALTAAEKPKAVEPTREELEKLGGFDAMPPDPAEYNLDFELFFVAVPAEQSLALIPRLKDPAQAEKACGEVQRMVIEKKARLVSVLNLTTRSGNRAVAEDIQEVRYPIEFEGAKFVAGKKPADAHKEAAPKDAKPGDKREDAPANETGVFPEVIPPMPTTFETRNAGCTLELEPVLDTPTSRIDLQLAAQHVHLAEYEEHTVTANGREVTLRQPRFETNKVSTNIILKSGQPFLLGTFTANGGEPGWVELFILRGTARLGVPGTPHAAPPAAPAR